jgi:Protein of unknown function (DUF2541)
MKRNLELIVRRFRRKAIFVMLVTLVVAFSASARGWEKIGERTVNLSTERDVIPCALKGKFRALKFRVEDAPVEFLSVNVEFATGERQRIPIKQRIRAGGETRTIDLRGNKRIIKKIEFVYRSVKGWDDRRRRAVVKVYGLE